MQWAAAALLVSAAWATDNRIVWAAFGVQLAIAFLLRRRAPAMEDHRIRHVGRMAWAAACILAIAFAVSVVDRGNRFYDRDAPVSTSIERDLRPAIWSIAWRRFLDAPWLGHGLGREILANDFIPLTPSTDHPQLRHGHNMFVDVALEMGLVGLAAFLGVFATLLLAYVRLLRDPAASPFAVLGLAILAGFVVKNLTDDFLHRHNGLVFWALNGALLGMGARAARRP
jgi:O-antigen ligase